MDVSLIPWCGKGFFLKGQLPVQTLSLTVSVQSPCAITCIIICVNTKSQTMTAIPFLGTQENVLTVCFANRAPRAENIPEIAFVLTIFHARGFVSSVILMPSMCTGVRQTTLQVRKLHS